MSISAVSDHGEQCHSSENNLTHHAEVLGFCEVVELALRGGNEGAIKGVLIISRRSKMSAVQPLKGKRKLIDDVMEKELTKKLFGNTEPSSESEGSFSESGSESDGDISESGEKLDESPQGLKPVWNDEDDKELLVNLPAGRKWNFLRRATDLESEKITAKEYEGRLREEFDRTQGKARSSLKWATIKESADNDAGAGSDDSDFDGTQEAVNEIAASAGRYVTKSDFLPKKIINFKRMNDITRGHRAERKPLTAVQFHPSKPVLMTAGESGVVNLFEVGLPASEESFIQSTQFENFPITTARLSSDGTKVIAGSKKRKHLFSYDLLEGKVIQLRVPKEVTNMNPASFALSPDGKYIAIVTQAEINVLSLATMELIAVFLASSGVKALQFCSLSNTLYALTGQSPLVSSFIGILETSEVQCWEIRSSSLVKSFRDDGGVRGSTFQISENSQFLACGSNTGIVNLYQMKDIQSSASPEPVKAFDQLTTQIDDVVFSKDSQILLISSSIKRNAVRLVHTRSRTVFDNFPCRTGSVGNVNVSDFSPNGGYLAIGDLDGIVSLFRLCHFGSY
ncbi:unnamed protein product [Enterobius vermicularis]|uniref:WD_REPEATS_REGION domain-containing protein n=1 Tax=Enterobius vermicularis TaxID=51028 RepID=A0A3P6H2R0_ENTVE|nr:unnamed protein product [Enterobius vermicularis]